MTDNFCPACGTSYEVAAGTCVVCGETLPTGRVTQPLAMTELLDGRYRLLRPVGEGGFSTVYEAQDTQEGNRRVAIKMIDLAGLSAEQMIEVTDAFNREVQFLSALQHPGLPAFHTHFADVQRWYMVMDFIEGETLAHHLEQRSGAAGAHGRGQLSPVLEVKEVLEIGIALCEVLDYLHRQQPPIIYRDLKPTNLMRRPDGRLVLIDFGIARRFRPGQARDTIPFGSPGYAAPEQYGRGQTTPQADLYSLGVLLHHLLSGDDPALTPCFFAPLKMQHDPALAPLEVLILQLVERDVSKRPESAAEVRQRLQTCLLNGCVRTSGGQAPSIASLQSASPTGAPAIRVITTASASDGSQMLQIGILPALPQGQSQPPIDNGEIEAMISLVLGGLSPTSVLGAFLLLFSGQWEIFLPLFGFAILASIIAIVFGHVARSKAYYLKSVRSRAVIGLCLAYSTIVFVFLLVCIIMSSLSGLY